jgi:hypothetical protein
MDVTDLGTAFGLDVKAGATELHVFKGSVEFRAASGAAKQSLREGAGAVAESSHPPRLITADEAAFASLLGLRISPFARIRRAMIDGARPAFASIRIRRCSSISI